MGLLLRSSLLGVQVLASRRLALRLVGARTVVAWTDRTHTCGELRDSHEGERVRLAGWVQYVRMDRFVLLRDAYGLTQLLLPASQELRLSLESVLRVEGLVRRRPAGQCNENMPTGDIEVEVEKVLDVCQARKDIPFVTREFGKAKEQTQLRYRYLALRDPALQENLRVRSAVIMKMRQFLTDYGFVDVDTPALFRRTPGGAQEFVVPTRIPGKFYSLTQSPQQFKQLLMVSGLDRYFQIAKCFRDEGGKPDRQPEFTQVDIELSFSDREGIMDLVERLVEHSWPSHLPALMLPFRRMTHAEAFNRFGTDKPDLRYQQEITDLTALLSGNGGVLAQSLSQGWAVKGISFKIEGDRTVSGKDVKSLEEHCVNIMKNNNKSPPGFIISSLVTDENGTLKCSLLKKFPESVVQQVLECMTVGPNHLGFIVCAKSDVALTALGHLRTELANLCLEIDRSTFEFVWITDFPLFVSKEADAVGCSLESAHHPFTRPHEDDLHLLNEASPDRLPQVRGQHYDLVLNGQEIAGGSIRIHEADLQRKVLEDILKEDVTELNHLLEALSFGCPPHGGIAIGLDRFIAIITNSKSIRDVIAFPKTADGRDPMSDSPADILQKDKDRYHIQLMDSKEAIGQAADDAPDQDMFSDDVSAVFPFPYHLGHEKAIRLDETYILLLSANSPCTEVAVALSTNDLALYDANSLVEKRTFPGAHKKTITGLHHSPKEPSIFYTSSLDECIKMWDVRESSTDAVRKFVDTSRDGKGPKQKSPVKPLTSFDVNSSDRLLCAGTEQVVKDSLLLFWDVRKSSLMGGYWDSHEDDITAVAFHPENEDRLATSGTDGIINVFDVSQSNEDEALETCVNTESSVQKLTWFHGGKGDNTINSLACLTHTEELHLWNVEDNEASNLFSREDLCVAMKRKRTDTAYFVDVFERSSDRQLIVLAGSSCAKNACLRLAQLKKDRLKPFADLGLKPTCSEMTRSLVYLKDTESILTGGEDGILRLWKAGGEASGKEKNVLKTRGKDKKAKATLY